MGVQLIPFGPNVPGGLAAPLQALFDAVSQLQNPDGPSNLAHVALITDLTRYPPDDYRGDFMICDEINAIVHSTAVTGTYTWLRADGSPI